MYERKWTVLNAANAGAAAIQIADLGLPGGEPELRLQTWPGIQAGGNIYIFEGGLTLAECQQRVSASGRVDCLTLVGYLVSVVRIPYDIANRLTVFFDANSASPNAVIVRIFQVPDALQSG